MAVTALYGLDGCTFSCLVFFSVLSIYYRTHAPDTQNGSLSHLILLKLERRASNVNFLICAIWQPSSPFSDSNLSSLLVTWHDPKITNPIGCYLPQPLLELAITEHQSHRLTTVTGPSMMVHFSRAHQPVTSIDMSTFLLASQCGIIPHWLASRNVDTAVSIYSAAASLYLSSWTFTCGKLST